ncbi:MAG: glycosyltransferase family 39 protein [Anaerolineae bacterium]|nr:glycosyltransferase family 39 protein [Anaerolineae bacterium]
MKLHLRAPWRLLAVVLIFALSVMATLWRREVAPDLFTDEILYARAGVRVAGEGALVWDRGEPIYVHPPLYFLAEGAFFRIAGAAGAPLYAAGDIFALVYHARILNALLAGTTAVLLYFLGRHLRNSSLGLLLAALFLLDPFGLRTNRRAMLETMAALLALLSMVLFLARAASPRRSSWPWAVGAGLLLGGALLVKELTITSIPALLLFGGWQARRAVPRRSSGRWSLPHMVPSLLVVSVAGLTYGLYPLWILGSAGWQDFIQVKWLSLQRLVGLVQISGWNRPGVSLVDFLLQRLAAYGSSYTLLGLGGVATAYLLWRHRDSQVSRLLVSWSLILYPFFGFVALLGSGNDQFFYFLLLPAIVLTGYAAVTLGDELRPQRWRTAWQATAGAFLVLLLAYNAVQWWTTYGAGVDNAYHRLSTYVQQQLPQVEVLNATGDALKFQYFFPDRLISAAGTPAEARAVGVITFALAPKDVELRYGRITPELAEWIVANGQLLTSAAGDSYGPIYLYHVDADVPAGATPPTPSDLESARPRQRRFGPATGGFVSGLLVGLVLWSIVLGAFAAALWVWSFRSPGPGADATPDPVAGANGGRS